MRDWDSWRWWAAQPSRIVLGFLIVFVLLVVAFFFVKYVLLPLLAGALVIIVLVAIIRYALTGRIGTRSNGGH